ncbi:MAG: PAS domain S-box protein, partial [Ignavibacteria bacterium]
MGEYKITHQEKGIVRTNLTGDLFEFQEFIDLLPEIVYELDAQGKITMVNKAGLDILGYTKEEFEKGIHVIDIISPDERDYFSKNIMKVLGPGNKFKFEYHAVKKNGSIIPVLVNGSPLIKNNKIVGSRGIILDLSERKQFERKLKESRDFLNATINAMQEPFFVKDENHKWVILNDAIIKMWGYNRDELIGKSDYEIFPEEQANEFCEKDDLVFKNGSNTNIE